MNKNITCLNCGSTVNGKFCSECGQSADTERFSVKHLFKKDLARKAFRFSGNFFYTAKKLLTQPGYSIREYVIGKRVKYLNYIDLLLLLVALDITLLNLQGRKAINQLMDAKSFSQLLAKYSNFVYVITIPIISLVTIAFFKKAKQNFAEHVVMNTYKTAGSLIISSIIYVCMYMFNEHVAVFLFQLSAACALIYSFWFYYQYFRQDYTLSAGYIIRISFAIILGLILASTVMLSLFYWLEKPDFEKLVQP